MKSISLSAAWAFLKGQDKRQRLAEAHTDYFDALYEHYYPSMYALLLVLVGTPEGAEDVASQVFEKAWLHLDDIRAPDMPAPWLYRIAHNCAADYFRHHKPTTSLEHLLPDEHPQDLPIEQAVIAQEEERILLTHLNQLSTREREVIGLKFVLEMTNREIARILDIPEGTVSSVLYRALRRLRAALVTERDQDETPSS